MFFLFGTKSVVLLILAGLLLFCFLLVLVRFFKDGYRADLFLGILLLAALGQLLPFLLGYAGWYSREPFRSWLFYWPLQQLLLIPVLFNFYLQFVLYPTAVFRRKYLLHFLPALIYNIYVLVPAFLEIGGADTGFYQNQRDPDFDQWYQLLGFLCFLGYLIASLARYARYRKWIFAETSFAEQLQLNWIRIVLTLFIVLCAARVLFFILNPEWGEFGKKFWYYLSSTILYVILGITGYSHSLLRKSLEWVHSQLKRRPAPLPAIVESLSALEPKTDQKMLSLEPAELAGLRHELEEHFEKNEPFLDPLLTLNSCAREIGWSPKKLSQTINQGYNQNFNDFINTYRCRSVIDKLKNGEHNLHTLLGIAMDAGFNSKSTFNRSFKRLTGQSPREYIDSQFKK
ncbi:MAG: helix-turn-helix domain-containing protein [Chitinophagaceae bacterium]